MKIAGGITQDGVVIGNSFDKYGSRNPLVRWMMNGFDAALSELVRKLQPAEIHEVGCGEGYWTMRWAAEKIAARGSDFSSTVIDIARANAAERGLPAEMFSARSIYDLDPATDAAELVVCCEVLEHLEHPEKALERLSALARPHLILSVPREPLWSALNMARGRYWSTLGNTPGHVQRWSRRRFLKLISRYVDVLEVRSPLPWTMVLCARRGGE